LGLYFENDAMIYSGIYEEDTYYENYMPEDYISDLTQLAAIAAASSCGQG